MSNIINKINKLLNEEYLDSEMINKKYIEFFVNPQKGELRSFKHVRFVIDNKRKRVIVWGYKVLHQDALEFLYNEGHIDTTNLKDKNIVVGDGDINKATGKIEVRKTYSSIKKRDDIHWADKYFVFDIKSAVFWEV
ncbi:MAG: hypothetical protein ACOC56_00905 [Atribacterota bacterium]